MKLDYTKPRFYRAEGFRLIPGVNEFNAPDDADEDAQKAHQAQVRRFMANAGVKARIASGEIKIIEGESVSVSGDDSVASRRPRSREQ